jgi:uncharacterized phage-like protein YoqJ
MKIIGITGHRKVNNIQKVEEDLTKIFLELKPDKIISGAAIGFDQITMKVAIKLNIPFIAAVPFKGQEVKWPEHIQKEYFELLSKAESVEYVCSSGFAGWKFQRRNEWIVDHCEKLICYWDGEEKGGTYNCLEYAKSIGKEYINIFAY